MIETIEQASEKLNAVKHRERDNWRADKGADTPFCAWSIAEEGSILYADCDAIRLAQSYENEERLDGLTEVLGAIKGELKRESLSDESIKRILRWIEDEEIEESL